MALLALLAIVVIVVIVATVTMMLSARAPGVFGDVSDQVSTGLATWSWTSLTVAVLVVLVGSTGLELVQERLSPTRITEWSDVAANAAGIRLIRQTPLYGRRF